MSTTRRLHIQPAGNAVIAQGMRDIQAELKLPAAFPPEVEAAAAKAAANPRLPELDRSDIALVTIDPAGSMDLDQALHVERTDGGYRVHYAIADVAAFVSPGDPVDLEAHRRGETLYGADARIPLHPKALSEGAASLLPGQLRPALLWTMELDKTGEGVAVDVRRARVTSRARLDYAGVQQRIDAGAAEPMWAVLREIGELRRQREQSRGGVSLPLPEQEVSVVDDRWVLAFRARLPLEDWNEQISLLTGMAAAYLMVQAKVGLLRTLPPPDPHAIERLRVTARVLGIAWSPGLDYPGFIRSLDPAKDVHVAMLTACTTLLRGAGYAAFDGALPAQSTHSALAAQYTHATAPLRRLVDRYTGEVCVALCAKQPVPGWALVALPGLPATMQASGHRASQYERAVLDLAEAAVLAPRVGEVFDGAIVEVAHDDPDKGTVIVREPAIEAGISGTSSLPLGADVKVTLVEADPGTRVTRFALAG
ncbi:ribonuclease II [Rhodanobacter sp. FW510-R12]|uniref:RNB domain-containing ribonuclease n=1 Tax=unclassified Rhodanobacter TaxID=2621553 RepID=UPI0007AA31E4|nr:MULTISPECIES: RNB domain-containing ribonuclease [unclassified Rhodanobacter]KZC16076.1 ribonuclease II [Rhodanobacter sp. FW104-R8]KZC26116.1 ribonuclease II [Rhodanobacter sp. FW510-T8]KZC30583.1 ribonuclease II [Rhodanobacter sp. FW510-R10]